MLADDLTKQAPRGKWMTRDTWFYLAAIACGMVTWILVSAASGRVEAWDSGWYFTVGMPVVCATSGLLGFLEPSRPWRWGVAPLAGQFVWMILTQGPGNLLPLGVLVFGVFSVPPVIAAQIGAFVAAKWARRA